MSSVLYLAAFAIGICSGDKDVYWREFNGTVPADAVAAGNETYIGQVVYQGFLIPGSVFPNEEKFVSEYYGRFEARDRIGILCSGNASRFKWERIHLDALPFKLEERAVEGGYQGEIRWYIGRAFHENQWRAGKVELHAREYRGLLIWNDDGSLARLFQFEMLTYL